MQTEVAILMPNYNNEDFLREAINSILSQTFTDFTFFIIDDGSSDSSVEIIKSYNDPRIVLIQKERNSGIVDALNIGLNQIESKYIVRMDGDDISTPDRIETLYYFMENNPEIGVCGSQMIFFGNDNSTTNYYLNKDKIKARLIFNSGVSHPSVIFRTTILKENNFSYTSNHPYMEDYDLFFRMKKHTAFANIDKVLYRYRLLEHNSTVKNKGTILNRYRNIYKDILNELDIEISEKNIELHLDFFINPTISYNIHEYKQWVNFLVSQNKKLQIYPQEALEEILSERWDIFFFKIAPMSIKKNIEYFILSKKINKKKLSYLFKLKINKLIGRKQ